MEVKSSLNRDEYGTIPDDWGMVAFEDLADSSIPWSIAGGPFGSNLKVSDYTEDGVRIIQLQNIGEGEFFDDYFIFTSDKKADELVACNIFPGEIILSKMGDPVARACFVPMVDNRYLMASDGIRLAVDKKRFDKYFVHYFINSYYFRKKAIEVSKGTTRQRIALSHLKKLPFVYPPLMDSTAIGTALKDVDGLLKSLDKLIIKKRNIKQGAMQELLTGERRLPGFSGEWEVKLLGDISEIKTGKKNSEDKVKDGQYPFFVRSQTVERINSFTFEGEAILVPGEGGIGSIFHYINGKFDYHQRVYKISDFDNEIRGKFIYYYMLQNFNKQAIRNSVKATVDSLRLPTFQGFELFAPQFEEQQAIATVLSDIDTEIATIEEQHKKTVDLKQGMMQELLKGRTRLV